LDLTILSGGQTGVDRGALQAALDAGVPCGGWCPRGRRSEDGPIPARFPLRETESAAYAERTRLNVRDSDGTLLLDFGKLRGGSALTAQTATDQRKPLLILEVGKRTPEEALDDVREFLLQHGVGALNVAGPRESEAPGAERWARELVSNLAALASEQPERDC
jgi:hypothetical protein